MTAPLVLTLPQERILRATRAGAVRLDGRNLRSIEALRDFGLVTFEAERVPSRTIKGRLDVVVTITPAGEQHFLREAVRYRR
jgi:hypothetical protein